MDELKKCGYKSAKAVIASGDEIQWTLKYGYDPDLKSDKKTARLEGDVVFTSHSGEVSVELWIWLLQSFPKSAPVVYVKPTGCQTLQASQFVNSSGKVMGIPLLTNWKKKNSLSELLGELRSKFCQSSPVNILPLTPIPMWIKPAIKGDGNNNASSLPLPYTMNPAAAAPFAANQSYGYSIPQKNNNLSAAPCSSGFSSAPNVNATLYPVETRSYRHRDIHGIGTSFSGTAPIGFEKLATDGNARNYAIFPSAPDRPPILTTDSDTWNTCSPHNNGKNRLCGGPHVLIPPRGFGSNAAPYEIHLPLPVTPVAHRSPSYPFPINTQQQAPDKSICMPTHGEIHVQTKKSTKDFFDTVDHAKCYEMGISSPSRSKGTACIINIKDIKGHISRAGTDVDRDELRALWIGLGFDVLVFNDGDGLTSQDILRERIPEFILKATMNRDTPPACVVLCLLSHGMENGLLGSDGEVVPIERILQKFDNTECRELIGVPKLFFIQACRGGAAGRTTTLETDSVPSEKLDINIPEMSDYLVAYPTHKGYVAHRDTSNGSWFVQAICSAFAENAHNEDINFLMTEVNQWTYQKVKEGHVTQQGTASQMSYFSSSLKRKLFFFPGLH